MVWAEDDCRREAYILGGWNVADFDDDVPHPPGEGLPVGGDHTCNSVMANNARSEDSLGA